MWICPSCERIFQKKNQQHSCKKYPIENHFKGKELMKKLFQYLLNEVNNQVGKCKVISLPCCIHLFGNYDFIAILPKKKEIEIRFILNRKIKSNRIESHVPVSAENYKNCLRISSQDDIDEELLKWLRKSYQFKK